jgi:hypothetical protein
MVCHGHAALAVARMIIAAEETRTAKRPSSQGVKIVYT